MDEVIRLFNRHRVRYLLIGGQDLLDVEFLKRKAAAGSS